MNKLKKGDEVIIIAGKDKGKKGIILSMIDAGEKVLVEGINLAKKHIKAQPDKGQEGGVITKPAPIHRSNVMLYDPDKQKGSRIGIRADKQTRYYKTSGQEVIDKKGN